MATRVVKATEVVHEDVSVPPKVGQFAGFDVEHWSRGGHEATVDPATGLVTAVAEVAPVVNLVADPEPGLPPPPEDEA